MQNKPNKNNGNSFLNAGRFSSWLYIFRTALRNGYPAAVPCGECNACCRSSRFVYIFPYEIRTLRQIPKELLFPAPLLPDGCKVLGYDKCGCCPMLTNNGCSIYKNRPMACRTFDCRILTAAGLESKGKNSDPVIQQARRWRFSYPTEKDRKLRDAVQSAATFLLQHRNSFRDFWVPGNTIQLAVLSIAVYDAFLDADASMPKTGKSYRLSDRIVEVMNAYDRFENRGGAVASIDHRSECGG